MRGVTAVFLQQMTQDEEGCEDGAAPPPPCSPPRDARGLRLAPGVQLRFTAEELNSMKSQLEPAASYRVPTQITLFVLQPFPDSLNSQ